MKALAAILAAVALAGCRPAPERVSFDRATAEAVAASHGPDAVLLCWSNAVRGASNQAELEARFAAAADKLAVDYLTTLAPGELARRLDTLKRGTSRSPYTEDQIHRARQAKGLE